MPQRILIVDDDPVQRRLLDNMVRRFGYDPLLAEGGAAALEALTTAESPVDAVVLDLVMPDLDGLGVLGRMRESGLGQPVIVQTAHGGIDNVISAMRAGAFDFVVKPVGAERLQVSLQNALKTSTLESELQRLKHRQAGTLTFRDIITRSPAMQAVLRMAEKAAASNIPVLVEGESGVGKELIARAVHGSGERRGKPFVAVNCGAIPDHLVESTLFGHERGAFTGATERHAGKFVEASGGTLFLDEIGELPPAAQVKLLRALQEGEVDPVGARRPVKVDVRIVSATNRDLAQVVAEGRFREDLFYRLHVYPLTIPPLRDRRIDIPDLIRHFLVRFAAEEGKRIRSISSEALEILCRLPWPGNVRQLENAMFRAVVLADGEEIGVGEFPQFAPVVPSEMPPALAADSLAPAAKAPILVDSPAMAPLHLAACGSQPDSAFLTASGEIRPLEEIEADVIRFAVAHCRGHMSDVARKLRIGRSTLYRRLRALGLDSGDLSEALSEPVPEL